MLFLVAGFADGDEPVDGLFSDSSFCIAFVMNLGGRCAAIHATPVVAPEDYIAISIS